MRHRKSGRKLNRNSSHRNAMFRNMMISLIDVESIKTTVPKAKELRGMIEKLVTKAGKSSDLAMKRYLFAKLRNDAAVKKLIEVIGPHYKSRPGGYTRILKKGYRTGDQAPMAMIQFV